MSLTVNKITVALFGAAAGGYKAEIEAYMNAHGEVATIAALLPLAGMDGSNVTDQEFARSLVSKLTTWLPDDVYSKTVNLVISYMKEHPEKSRAEVVIDMINALESVPSTDSAYGLAADWFRYKVGIADLYTDILNGRSKDLYNLLQPIVQTISFTNPSLISKIYDFDITRAGSPLAFVASRLTDGRMQKVDNEHVVKITEDTKHDSYVIEKNSVWYVETYGPQKSADGNVNYLSSYNLMPSHKNDPSIPDLAAYLDQFFVGTTTPGDEAIIVINWTGYASTTSFIYEYTTNQAASNDIAPDEIRLVGIVNRGDVLMHPGNIV